MDVGTGDPGGCGQAALVGKVLGRGFLLKERVLQVLQFGCGMLRGGGDAVEWGEGGKKFHSGERKVRNSILKLASQG